MWSTDRFEKIKIDLWVDGQSWKSLGHYDGFYFTKMNQKIDLF